MVDVVTILCFTTVFTYLAVWHGGNLPPKTPKFIKNSVWSIAQLLVVPHLWYILIAAYVLNLLKTLGHGLYFSLGHVIKYIKAERIDPLVSLFFGRDPRTVPFTDYSITVPEYGVSKLYWRCMFGLAISGLLAAIGTVLALLWVGMYLDGIIIAVAASIGKAGGYALGWKYPRVFGLEPNHTGDIFTGASLGAALGWVFVF